mgnify:CR=1 FL=1|jgi:hypothetical protein
MKRGLVAAGAVALLLLTGCTSTVTSETITVTPGASGTYSDGDTTVEVHPLTAETPATSDDETVFLETVRAKLRPENVIPNATDEQLLAAGEAACDKIASTENTNTISVIEGEQPNGLGYFTDSGVIVGAARASLCD